MSSRLSLVVAVLAAVALSPAPASAGTVTCKPNPLEIVFAVDVSSSLTRSDFAKLKKFLQAMSDHLPISATETRPAAISFSTKVTVEVDLGEANDPQTFKNAIEAIPYYRGFTSTGQAMQKARRTVFSKSRPGASKLLVVVTDGRANYPTRAEAIALVRSEAAALRNEDIRVHAIGIGDVWLKEELEAITGSDDYSMIHDFEGLKAMVDKMVKEICDVKCEGLGAESYPGQCFSGTQRVVHVTKTHNKALGRCEKAITHEYKYCGKSHLCKDVDVTVEDCVNGVRKVVTTWEDFDVKLQKCVTRRSVQEMDCNAIEECKEPVAEIIFLLDSSNSMKVADWNIQISFTHRMIQNMKVAPGAIHVGAIVFGNSVWNDIPLGSISSKTQLLQRILNIKRRTWQNTNIGDAITLARREFNRRGRPGVSRMAVLLTDGESNRGANPVVEASKLESDGGIMVVIGVGQNLARNELKAIATPPLTDNLFFATDYDKLMNWAGKISQETCESITPPDPSLCDLPPKRLVSACYNSLQKITQISYTYDAQGRCTKKMKSHTIKPCAVVCTDPINGNQYTDGETWKSECATFKCYRPTSQTEVFKPIAQECSGSDSKCFASTSTNNFKCHDDRGELFSHCNCEAKNGNPLLRVITADSKAKP